MTLAFLALAWLLGIAAAAFTGADPAAALAAAALLATVTFARRPRPVTLLLVAAGIGIGFLATWRYESTLPTDAPSGIARYNDGPAVRFRAIVDAEPDDRGASQLYRLQVRETLIDGLWQPDSGQVLVTAASFPRFEYGDLLELEGELDTPPRFSDFDYREYLLRRGIGSLASYPKTQLLESGQGNPVRAALIDIRGTLSGSLANALPEPEASLAAGILLGARSDIPRDLKDDMNSTGTSHLVAVSGQNVTLLAGLLMTAVAWIIGRRPAAWLALAAVIGYAVLVGGHPSVIRAAIMAGLYIAAVALGRQNSAPAALALAAAGMTAFDPQLAHDVSFQLSFAATLGLITMAPLLRSHIAAAISRRPFAEFPLTQPVTELAAITVAAIAFTLPITAVNFHRISLVAPAANLFAVPAFIAVAITSAVTAIATTLLPAAADYLGWITWPPTAYMVTVVRLFADIPLASIELRGVGTGHAIAYYTLLTAAVWLLARRPAPQPTQIARPVTPATPPLLPATGMALILALSSLLLWLAITAPASGRLTVTFMDVGQGDAILIEGPAGHRILVDGGPSGEAISSALGRRLPFYDRRIDLIILTRPQSDHMGGLPTVLDRYDVGGVLASTVEADSAAFQAWQESVADVGLPNIEAKRGQWFDLGGGARLTFMGPLSDLLAAEVDDPNETSVVLKLTMGRAAILLTGDMGEEGEEDLIRSGTDLRAAVLKLGHHGSASSSSARFLDRVLPIVDVISVGANNRYGHPSQNVLERLDDDLILRTDRHGDISVSTDGQRLWIKTQNDRD
jgi:competence protein ComEC